MSEDRLSGIEGKLDGLAAAFAAGQANTDARLTRIETGQAKTGARLSAIETGQAKLDALIEERGELGLDKADVMAIGDGANDRLMVEEAGLGVAYRAKPALAEVADARIEHHGLDALLWAQGIRKKEWISG